MALWTEKHGLQGFGEQAERAKSVVHRGMSKDSEGNVTDARRPQGAQSVQ